MKSCRSTGRTEGWTRRQRQELGGFGRHLVEALGQRVPAQGGALDAHRELHHALQRGQLAQLVEVDLLGLALHDLGAVAVASGSSAASWIDIIPLKVPMSRRTSSTGLPLTAADISEAEDWLMEQPEPPILRSASLPSSTDHATRRPRRRTAG